MVTAVDRRKQLLEAAGRLNFELPNSCGCALLSDTNELDEHKVKQTACLSILLFHANEKIVF